LRGKNYKSVEGMRILSFAKKNSQHLIHVEKKGRGDHPLPSWEKKSLNLPNQPKGQEVSRFCGKGKEKGGRPPRERERTAHRSLLKRGRSELKASYGNEKRRKKVFDQWKRKPTNSDTITKRKGKKKKTTISFISRSEKRKGGNQHRSSVLRGGSTSQVPK